MSKYDVVRAQAVKEVDMIGLMTSMPPLVDWENHSCSRDDLARE
jgi:hypothetical protein